MIGERTEVLSCWWRLCFWLLRLACLACFACSSASSGSKAPPVGAQGGSGDAAVSASSTPDAGALTGSPGSGGYYVSAGDFAPATADKGVYIETPNYDANDSNASHMVVQPGQEIFLCYYVTLPNTTDVSVGGFQSWMSEGSSHHFIVYQQGGTSFFAAAPQPNGTITSCGAAFGTWVYATSTPGSIIGFNMPDGVGLPFKASTQLILNMHFINTSTNVLYPKVKLNVLYANNVKYNAAAMVSFNIGINVPPASASGPGTQTVSGTCSAPAGSKFFTMSTHTHKHATAAVVNFVSGGSSTEIVHTGTTTAYPSVQQAGTGTDWEHPGVAMWRAPDFLTVNAGDSFTYSCTYENTDPTTAVTVGETAAKNEMCMAVGYYFPAGSARCN